MTAYINCSGFGPRSLGDSSQNAMDLNEYLHRDTQRLTGVQSESAGLRFQWSWHTPGSAGIHISQDQFVWAVQAVGSRFHSTGWVTCRRVETTNPALPEPDVDHFWSCIRTLPVRDDELQRWGFRDLGRMERMQVEGYNRQYNATIVQIFTQHSRNFAAEDRGEELDAYVAHDRAVQRMHAQAQRLMTEAAFSLAVSAGTANNASWTAAGGVGEFAARHGARLPVRR